MNIEFFVHTNIRTRELVSCVLWWFCSCILGRTAPSLQSGVYKRVVLPSLLFSWACQCNLEVTNDLVFAPKRHHLFACSRNCRYSEEPFTIAGETLRAKRTVRPAGKGFPTSHVTNFKSLSDKVHRNSVSCSKKKQKKKKKNSLPKGASCFRCQWILRVGTKQCNWSSQPAVWSSCWSLCRRGVGWRPETRRSPRRRFCTLRPGLFLLPFQWCTRWPSWNGPDHMA